MTRAGTVVFPPVMAFYMRPKSIHEMVEQSVRRMIDLLGLEDEGERGGEGGVEEGRERGRWEGFD